MSQQQLRTETPAAPVFSQDGQLVSKLVEQAVWCDELQAEPQKMPWLWHGYLAPGKITLLTSMWKSGKTTLIAHLLGRLQAGGELAGLPVARGTALVVSEEATDNWQERRCQLGLGRNVRLLCRPFRILPGLADWQALLQAIAQLHARQAIDLVVIDPLAAFLPFGNENASALKTVLAPLRQLTELGLAVLLVHHPRKGASQMGQAARGSGVLTSFVDILVEMYFYDDPESDDRRRKLYGYSRHGQTPRSLVIELNAEGTAYLNRGSADDQEFLDNWQLFQSVLETAEDRLTPAQIREQWPGDQTVPHQATVHRWLKRAEARGLVARCGKGSRGDPYRYWLPGREDRLPLPPGASHEETVAHYNRRIRELAQKRARESGELPG